MSNYLDYIREKPCLVCGIAPCDAHHLEASGMGGANDDSKDYSCVPLCRKHHDEYHRNGLKEFEFIYKNIKLNLYKDAFNLIRRYFIERTNNNG